jgi:hypothetical protein
LNKYSCLARALGVTKFVNMGYMIVATLCYVTYVRLKCVTNPPRKLAF